MFRLDRILLLFILSSACVFLVDFCFGRALSFAIPDNLWESGEIRAFQAGESGLLILEDKAEEWELEFSEVVTAAMVYYRFSIPDIMNILNEFEYADCTKTLNYLINKEAVSYYKLLMLYSTVLDIEYFPVPANTRSSLFVTFEDTWGVERSYGGERLHEGCDLMAENNTPDVYPVISVSDGVIEQIGWLPLGGYRIGVRSSSGGYFYYAHLSSYAPDIQTGDEILAGQLLGFMGDTGYGDEGTSGLFPVHLHFGIYITDGSNEYSFNPYSILCFLENKTLAAAY